MHLLLLPLFTLGILATATFKAQVESSFCPADLSLAQRIQHFNTNIQRGIAGVLDAQEKRCITASNADASEAGVTEAMTSLDDWVALYYRSFGIWHLPSQADFWDLGKRFNQKDILRQIYLGICRGVHHKSVWPASKERR